MEKQKAPTTNAGGKGLLAHPPIVITREPSAAGWRACAE